MEVNPKDFENKTICITANVPKRFAKLVEKYHRDFNIELISMKPFHEKFISVTVHGKNEDLILLNKKCMIEAYEKE